MGLTFPKRLEELDLEAEPSPRVGIWIQVPLKLEEVWTGAQLHFDPAIL